MSDYKRLTKQGGMCESSVYSLDFQKYVCGDYIVAKQNDGLVQQLIERLAELEDKIENGTLIGLPRIIHPNRMEWYVQYQYPNGVIQYYICFSKPEANAKLKELKEKRNG